MKVAHELNQLYLQHGPFTLIHGACATGAGAAAAHWYEVCGRDLGCIEVRYKAEWDKYRTATDPHGRRAGPIRNEKMVKEASADLVLAFPLFDSRGTKHTIALAEAAGIPVKKVMA